MYKDKITRRDFIKGSVASACLLALSGCGEVNTTKMPEGVYGGTMSWRLSKPKSLDPAFAVEDESIQVIYQLFDSLLTYDFKQKSLVGLAAEKWEVNSDEDEFIFHLNKKALFHNMDPVTSQSFKRGFERVANPSVGSPLAFHLNTIEGYEEFRSGEADGISGITCPDDYTLTIKLSAPYADFLYVAALPYLVPIPEKFDPKAMVGNGAFKLESLDTNKIVLLKFDEYTTPSFIDEVDFMVEEDVDAAYNEFLAGSLSVCDIPFDKYQDAIQECGVSADGFTISPGKQCAFGEKPSCSYLVINCEDELLQDEDLRRAISLAINRQNIVDEVFYGEVKVADNLISPAIKGYEADGWSYSHYDKQQAVDLLDEKWPEDHGSRGLKFTIDCNKNAGYEKFIELVAQDLNEVGIDTTINYLSWDKYLNKIEDGNFQIARLAWNADMPIMDNFLYPLFYSTGSCNYSRYTAEDLDTNLDEARSISKESSRLTAFKDINKQLGEACPLVPLYYTKMAKVGSKAIKSAVINPDGICKMSTVELNV